ncbi:hypothetical protein IMZ48_40215 [Candidatus Bathyarchaeota archaeon]|nr:hypothetical protein [Candidatus Bathyarchaeota archaeon]
MLIRKLFIRHAIRLVIDNGREGTDASHPRVHAMASKEAARDIMNQMADINPPAGGIITQMEFISTPSRR